MKNRIIQALVAAGAALLIAGSATAQSAKAPSPAPLQVEILQTGAGSLYTGITLVKGEKGAVLIDAPFTRADAHRVLAAVLESGKSLEKGKDSDKKQRWNPEGCEVDTHWRSRHFSRPADAPSSGRPP